MNNYLDLNKLIYPDQEALAQVDNLAAQLSRPSNLSKMTNKILTQEERSESEAEEQILIAPDEMNLAQYNQLAEVLEKRLNAYFSLDVQKEKKESVVIPFVKNKLEQITDVIKKGFTTPSYALATAAAMLVIVLFFVVYFNYLYPKNNDILLLEQGYSAIEMEESSTLVSSPRLSDGETEYEVNQSSQTNLAANESLNNQQLTLEEAPSEDTSLVHHQNENQNINDQRLEQPIIVGSDQASQIEDSLIAGNKITPPIYPPAITSRMLSTDEGNQETTIAMSDTEGETELTENNEGLIGSEIPTEETDVNERDLAIAQTQPISPQEVIRSDRLVSDLQESSINESEQTVDEAETTVQETIALNQATIPHIPEESIENEIIAEESSEQDQFTEAPASSLESLSENSEETTELENEDIVISMTQEPGTAGGMGPAETTQSQQTRFYSDRESLQEAIEGDPLRGRNEENETNTTGDEIGSNEARGIIIAQNDVIEDNNIEETQPDIFSYRNGDFEEVPRENGILQSSPLEAPIQESPGRSTMRAIEGSSGLSMDEYPFYEFFVQIRNIKNQLNNNYIATPNEAQSLQEYNFDEMSDSREENVTLTSEQTFVLIDLMMDFVNGGKEDQAALVYFYLQSNGIFLTNEDLPRKASELILWLENNLGHCSLVYYHLYLSLENLQQEIHFNQTNRSLNYILNQENSCELPEEIIQLAQHLQSLSNLLIEGEGSQQLESRRQLEQMNY